MQEIADREGIAQFTSASSQQHRIFSKATSAKSRKAKDDFFFFFFVCFGLLFFSFFLVFVSILTVQSLSFFLKRHLVEAKIRPNNQQKIECNLKLKSLNWLSWHQNNSEETVQAHRGVICNKLSEKVNRIRKIWSRTNYTQLKLKNIGEIFLRYFVSICLNWKCVPSGTGRSGMNYFLSLTPGAWRVNAPNLVHLYCGWFASS